MRLEEEEMARKLAGEELERIKEKAHIEIEEKMRREEEE